MIYRFRRSIFSDLKTPEIPQHETELQAARDAIVDDTLEPRRLVLGPRDYLMSYHASLFSNIPERHKLTLVA